MGLRLAFLSEGFPDIAEQSTEESRRISQAEAMITDTALNMIKNDDSIKKSMAEASVKNIVEEMTQSDRNKGPVSDVSLVAEVIAELKKSVLSTGILHPSR